MSTSMQHPVESIVNNTEHKEGPVTRMIEKQTAKLPSDTFLIAAGLSIITSLVFKSMGQRHNALFVGQWAAPFLLLGIYNKIVKVSGSDKDDQEQY
jgi:hypothetical protein